jgi:hypothetical protein
VWFCYVQKKTRRAPYCHRSIFNATTNAVPADIFAGSIFFQTMNTQAVVLDKVAGVPGP